MFRFAVVCAFAAAVSLPSDVVASQGALNSRAVLEGKLVSEPFKIDGHPEDAWSSSARFENFAEFMPTHKVAAKVQTEGFIAHDRTDLYVAFRVPRPGDREAPGFYDGPGPDLSGRLCGVVIDTYGDQKRAYEFFSNPLGIQGDMLWAVSRSEEDDGAIWQAQGGEDEGFDAVWESAGSVYEDRWVVEMRIPLSSLRYPNRSDQTWAVHFVRVYPRENRYQFSWMPISQGKSLKRAVVLLYTN